MPVAFFSPLVVLGTEALPLFLAELSVRDARCPHGLLIVLTDLLTYDIPGLVVKLLNNAISTYHLGAPFEI